ncbi:MAG: hypothetical protein ACI8Z5_001926 [Lentimonas sp.]|jgi:hypothetical protein
MRIGQDGRMAARCRDYIREHFNSLRTMEEVGESCPIDLWHAFAKPDDVWA